MLFLILISFLYIQTQPRRVQIQLVLSPTLLQNLRNIPCVLDPPQIHITPALLDGVADELGGAGFSLRAHDCRLLLLAGLVDDKGGTLGFLLGDLLGFDGSGKFGGEGEVLLGGY